MRFVCKHCGSKYTIADDRVRSKVLKIRCKKCKNIIEICDSTASKPPDRPIKPSQPKGGPVPSPAAKLSAQAPKRGETNAILWFVAIDSAPVGPMSARKVRAHRRAKQVDDTSLVWKEGIPDWIPLRDCKQLIGLLATLDIEATTTEKKQGASIIPAPRQVADSGDGEPSERPAPIQKEGKGVFPPAELSEELAFFKETEGGEDPDSLLLTMESRISSIQSLAPPRPIDKNQRVTMFAAVGFFVVAAATLGIAIFGGEETGEAKTVETVEKVIEKVVYRDRIVEKEVQVFSIPSEETLSKKSKRSGKSGGVAENKSKEETRQSNDARTQELMKRFGMSAPLGSAPTSDREIGSSGSSNSSGTGALTANQVKGVVNRNKSQLKTCYERALRIGEAPEERDLRADFKLVVGSSGIVKKVVIGGEAARLTSLQRCLTQSVKKWIFPSSSDESPVEFPFLFTPR
jgi:predicted Zn finger-like uncharacterized protein